MDAKDSALSTLDKALQLTKTNKTPADVKEDSVRRLQLILELLSMNVDEVIEDIHTLCTAYSLRKPDEFPKQRPIGPQAKETVSRHLRGIIKALQARFPNFQKPPSPLMCAGKKDVLETVGILSKDKDFQEELSSALKGGRGRDPAAYMLGVALYVDRIEEYQTHNGGILVKYMNTWFPELFLLRIKELRKHYRARPDDILLASIAKSGTTWTKAIIYTILNYGRQKANIFDQYNPHELAPPIEFPRAPSAQGQIPSEEELPSPRFLQTHLPYHILPDSIKASGCKFVYVSRDPRDTFISYFHFVKRASENENLAWSKPDFSMEGMFDDYCNGAFFAGPFKDHVQSYWGARDSANIHFLTFESLKNDTARTVRGLAAFLGRPDFTDKEIDDIIQRCSFESMANSGSSKRSSLLNPNIDNAMFFRKGNVGDWKQDFTPEMQARAEEALPTLPFH
ncbi:uncharacterized protein VTP21DRAFT_7118 [Calcarisporiella thermophila]|uniref:uncharacterized protein n=1 Tax=Calcarisporiella thermophila TaxID=911321 RepID=UPI00374424E5